MTRYDYCKPSSLRETFSLKKEYPEALYIAGGTDVMVAIKDGMYKPEVLISLRSVRELSGIDVGSTTRIGPNTSIAQIIDNQHLNQQFPLLISAAKRLGSPQVRNVGTIGGNLCTASPCADTSLALLTLGARVKVTGSQGVRELELTQLFKGPKETALVGDEVLSDIILDPLPQPTNYAFFKKGRIKMDMAVVSLAVQMDLDGSQCQGVRVSAGSVAPTTLRLKEVEQLLVGSKIDQNTAEKARQLASSNVTPIDDVRSTATYRRHLVGVYMYRALGQIMGWGEV